MSETIKQPGAQAESAQADSVQRVVQPHDDELDNDEMGYDREWCDRCGNLGVIICHCGGDLCVCENQGEYPCPDCG